MFDADVLKDPDDYSEMAQPRPRCRLSRRGPEGAASRASSSNVFTDQRTKDKPSACWTRPRSAPPPTRARSPKLEQEAMPLPTATRTSALGLAYIGYDQYDKAADHLSQGLSKGGVQE